MIISNCELLLTLIAILFNILDKNLHILDIDKVDKKVPASLPVLMLAIGPFGRLHHALYTNDHITFEAILAEETGLGCKALLEQDNNLLDKIITENMYPFIKVVTDSPCFQDMNVFLAAVDVAINHDKQPILNHLIAIAQMHTDHSFLQNIFYKCFLNKNYDCIHTILQFDPFISFNGQTLLHLSAHFDDCILFAIIKTTDLLLNTYTLVHYLNIQDNYNKLAVEYIHSIEMLDLFESTIEDANDLLKYPKEIETILQERRSVCLSSHLFSWQSETLNSRLRIVKSLFDFFDFNQEYDEDSFCISRQKVLEYSYFMAESFGTCWYFPRLFVTFNVHFIGEIGIDSKGLTVEWLNLLLESFFKVDPIDGSSKQFTAPLFEITDDESGMYAPNNLYPPEVYRFAGSILALALYHGFTIKVKFIESVYRTIWDIEPFRSEEDLKLQSPTLYTNLHKDTEVDIKKYSENSLYYNYQESIDAFADGFYSKTGFVFKQYFNLAEFKLILTGSDYDTDTIPDFFKYSHFSESLFSYSTFKTAVESFSTEEMRSFLKFITGRSSLPFGGIKMLPTRISITFNVLPRTHIPTSSTCNSQLYLPSFYTCAESKKKLLFAINNCHTFHEV